MPGLSHSDKHVAPDCTEGVWHKELLRLMRADAEQSEILIPVVVSTLEERIAANDKQVLAPGEFFKMNISVRDYLGRIVQYSNASPCCYAIGLIWMERLKNKGDALLTTKTYQRTVLGVIMLACKYLDDFYYSNKHWAQIGGIPTKELNEIEINLLNKLDFKLHIQREEYDWYVEKLYNRAQRESHSGPLSAPQQPAMAHSPPKPTSVSPPTSMSKSLWSMFFDKRGSSKDLHRSTSGSSQLSEEALSAMNTPRNITVAQPMSGSSLAGPASGPGTASFSMPMSYSIAPSSHNQCPVFLRDPAAPAAPQGGSMQRQRVQQQQQAPPQKQMMPPPQQQYQAQQQQFHAPPQQQQQALHCRAPQQMYAPNYVQATQQQQQPMHCFQAPAPVPGPQQVVFFQG